MNKEAIDAWLIARDLDKDSGEYLDYSWAVDMLYDQACDHPAELLTSVINILDADSTPETMGALGAGPIEDLFLHHGSDCINEIERIARSNPKFKGCLLFTFLDEDDVSKDVYVRLQKIKSSDKK
ncbi:DUF6869 domain-containing protein [Pseudoxanthomonas sp. UC19_8]|uniref:DUF6869 domain-containing protein n=1 Tax=Pseudoxanthomonas sp. UC19_8 TaxID=3350175 RepID=UPI0036D3FAD5